MIDIRETLKSLMPELIEFRHDLHAHPELAYRETRTATRVLDRLNTIDGLHIRSRIAKTGIVATLNADRDGPCIALRGDMDALPVQEQTRLPYASKNDGCMHACGHDGHTTCLLGAALVLARHTDELPGKVKFIFQPAEEGGGGARLMIDGGALDGPKVDAAFALHGWPQVPVGSILVGSGPVLAACTSFRIVIKGRGAHAAFPHHGDDTVLTSAHLITALQAIRSRFIDPLDRAVVSVCSVQAGHTFNVLPDRCEMLGTVRSLKQATHEAILADIRRMAASTAQSFNASAEVEFLESYPVVMNDPSAADLVAKVARKTLGDAHVLVDDTPVMGSEDFAFFSQRVPSTFYCLGVRPVGEDHYPQLHSPNYDFSDDAIPVGVSMHCALASHFLSHPLANRCG